MIISEYRIRDLVAEFPAIQINADISRTPNFHWGNKKELIKYLKLKKDDSYPLIWLLPGAESKNESDLTRVIRDCTFILAHLEIQEDLFNSQRYDKSYRFVLDPLADTLIQALNGSSISRLTDTTYTLTKFPNYSNEEIADQNGTVALWDAIRITCTVEFNNFCLKDLKFITR